MVEIGSIRDAYRGFVERAGPRLRLALVCAFGPDMGSKATSKALVWGWEHWDRLGGLENPAGQLYRVGARKVPRMRRPRLPSPSGDLPPNLTKALEQLAAQQRAVLLLISGFGLTRPEVAQALGTSRSTVERDFKQAQSQVTRQLEVAEADLTNHMAAYAPELDEAASPFEELRPRLPVLVRARPPAGPSGRWLPAATAAAIILAVIAAVALLLEFQ